MADMPDGALDRLATTSRRMVVVDGCETQARALRRRLSACIRDRRRLQAMDDVCETVIACCDMARHQLEAALAWTVHDLVGEGRAMDNVVTDAKGALAGATQAMPTLAMAVDVASDLDVGLTPCEVPDVALGEARLLDLTFAMRDAVAADSEAGMLDALSSNMSWLLVANVPPQVTSELDARGHTDRLPVPKGLDVRRSLFAAASRLSGHDADAVVMAFPDWLETVELGDGMPVTCIQHPGSAFNRRAKNGEFAGMPEDEYGRLLASVNRVAELFGSARSLPAAQVAMRLALAGSEMPGSGSALDRALVALGPHLRELNRV